MTEGGLMQEPAADASFGAFGKMPALGDFFRLRVAQDFVTVWDAWLQEVLLTSRDLLGDRYDDCYMTAPVWHFVLGPGLAGAQGVMGVIMPSVDRVGRQFPLTLVGPSGPGAPLHILAYQMQAFATLENLALAALGDDMTRDSLSDALANVGLLAPAPGGQLVRGAQGQALIGSAPQAAIADLALELAPGDLHQGGVWSTVVDGQTRISFWQGLPRGPAAAALFDMDAGYWTGRDEPLPVAVSDPETTGPLRDVFDEIGIGQG